MGMSDERQTAMERLTKFMRHNGSPETQEAIRFALKDMERFHFQKGMDREVEAIDSLRAEVERYLDEVSGLREQLDNEVRDYRAQLEEVRREAEKNAKRLNEDNERQFIELHRANEENTKLRRLYLEARSRNMTPDERREFVERFAEVMSPKEPTPAGEKCPLNCQAFRSLRSCIHAPGGAP